MNKMITTIYFCIIIAISLSPFNFVTAYKPLGSIPPDKCEVSDYTSDVVDECPSHYVCIDSVCKCDQFYGFHGPTCEKLSFTSYFYTVLSFIVMSYCLLGCYYNIHVLIMISRHGKLNLGIRMALILSVVCSLFPFGILLEYPVTVFNVDEQMFVRQYIRAPAMVLLFLANMLSSFKISDSWIRLTRRDVNRKVKVCRNYDLILSGCILCYLCIALVSLSDSVAFRVMITSTPILIVISYWYGGIAVVKTLRAMHKPDCNQISDVVKSALELANAVEVTTGNMIFYSFLMVIFGFIAFFTMYDPDPVYSEQNHLPTWAQGQPIVKLVFACKVRMSIQVGQYFHYVYLRTEMKYVPMKGKTSFYKVIMNMSKPSDDSVHEGELLTHRARLSLYGIEPYVPGLSPSPINGVKLVRIPVSKHVVSDVSQDGTSNMPKTSDDIPMALINLNTQTYQIVSTPATVQSIEEKGRFNINAGSHAFVRCVGESFIRCTLETFEFGCAEHHALLAGDSDVLMAGELEVDDEGVLTRWLNKSDSYSVPQNVIGQAGLPYDKAWLHMSHSEVLAMEVEKRRALEDAGCLVKLTNQTMSMRVETSSSVATSIDANATLSSDITPLPRAQYWIMKVDHDPTWHPSISSKAYAEAKQKVYGLQDMVKKVLTIRKKHNQVKPMNDAEIIGIAVNHVYNVDIDDGLDPECDAYFQNKKMIFDMSEDYAEDERKILETVNEMKRQMEAAGVFDTHRRGTRERRHKQAELGFSPNLKLGFNRLDESYP